MKTHSPGVKDLEKKFFCHHCGKGFKSQNSLFAHQCKKHPDLISNGNGRIVTKYNCKLCGRAYSNEGSFKKHMEGHHQQQQQPPPQQQQQPQQPQSAYVGSTNSIWSCSVCSSAFQDEFGMNILIEKKIGPNSFLTKCFIFIRFNIPSGTDANRSKTSI